MALFLFHLAKAFLPGNDAADELAKWGVLFLPSEIPCCLSSFISRIRSCFCSDWRPTVLSKFCNTQVFFVSTKKLLLSRHARCVLSRLHSNEHSLLLSSYLSRISKIENPLCNACGHSSQKIFHSARSSGELFAPLAFWRPSVSLRTLVQTLCSCPASGAPWFPPCLHLLEGVR